MQGCLVYLYGDFLNISFLTCDTREVFIKDGLMYTVVEFVFEVIGEVKRLLGVYLLREPRENEGEIERVLVILLLLLLFLFFRGN